jgi:hypothetical protein
MNSTTEFKPETEMNAAAKIAAIPTLKKTIKIASDVSPGMPGEDLAYIKKVFLIVFGCFAALFVLALMLPNKNKEASTSSTTGATSTPAAATPAAGTTTAATSPHKASGAHSVKESFPKELTAHHLYDQDYSLTWKDMGAGYTYRVYYANDKQMRDATVAFFKPVEGTLYRFTMNGDASNVWMAIAPVDGNGHEGVLSRPVNIGKALLQKS